MATNQVFTNGRIYTASVKESGAAEFADCMVIEGEKIVHVGHEQDKQVQKAIQDGAKVVNLKDRVVVPGFIDAHTHLLFFGLSLKKLDLENCTSLEEVRSVISEHAKQHPELPRILCRGWQQSSTGRSALASQLDGLTDRPVYVEALDLHSTWCNTAALNELNLDDDVLEKYGDQITRDENGKASGLLAEGAQTEIVWPYLMRFYTTEEKQAALEEGFSAYVAAGYTGAIDMAMDKDAWEALKVYRKRNNGLPLHIAAHWFIPHGATPEELTSHINEAIAQYHEWHPSKSPDFCIVGIKLICDGVVDGCTAALSHPYTGRSDIVGPLWKAEDMNVAVARATEAGLQCAVHAIGDAAITQAINAIAKTKTTDRRHRVEHLELASEEDAKRLGQLGITASVQPVHSDPAILKDYPKLIGPHSWKRAFSYKEFLDGKACIAIGTDAPTARHLPLPNLYNATTRRSATQPELPQTNPSQAITLAQAFHGATAGAAYSRFAEEWTGSLRKGLRADFVVLDYSWSPETLLQAKVEQTWSGGQKLYQAK
jgi:predicted amidohydrolase YtcJ